MDLASLDIERGSIRLRYFTVRRCDFSTTEPEPPWRYFLVTQVFGAAGEYEGTQLLGIDLRAVRGLERQGFPCLTQNDLSDEDRERIRASLRAYANYVVDKMLKRILR